MSRIILRIGACLLVVGVLLFAAGGLRIRGDAEGRWLLIGPVQLASGASLLAGTAVTLLAAALAGRPKSSPA